MQTVQTESARGAELTVWTRSRGKSPDTDGILFYAAGTMQGALAPCGMRLTDGGTVRFCADTFGACTVYASAYPGGFLPEFQKEFADACPDSARAARAAASFAASGGPFIRLRSFPCTGESEAALACFAALSGGGLGCAVFPDGRSAMYIYPGISHSPETIAAAENTVRAAAAKNMFASPAAAEEALKPDHAGLPQGYFQVLADGFLSGHRENVLPVPETSLPQLRADADTLCLRFRSLYPEVCARAARAGIRLDCMSFLRAGYSSGLFTPENRQGAAFAAGNPEPETVIAAAEYASESGAAGFAGYKILKNIRAFCGVPAVTAGQNTAGNA